MDLITRILRDERAKYKDIYRCYDFTVLCWKAGEYARARIWADRMTALVRERNRLEQRMGLL